MSSALAVAGTRIGRVWAFLRALSGDADYDAHVARARARRLVPLSRQDFYLDRLRRKYSRPNRCC